MKRPKIYKSLIIAAAILVVIGYLIFTGIRDTMAYYLTVSEVLAKPREQLTDIIKVGGIITPGSVKWDPQTLKLSFALTEKPAEGAAAQASDQWTKLLTVYYTGAVPDSFKPASEVIVEGAYRGDGNFFATNIMPKCASKYE